MDASWRWSVRLDRPALRGVCRDGSQRWVNINVRRQTEEAGEDGEARTHFAGSVQDVEHRHVIEQALQRSEARFRLLVEHTRLAGQAVGGRATGR